MADSVTPIFTSAYAPLAVAASTPVATQAAPIQRQTNCISTPSIIVFFIAPDFVARRGRLPHAQTDNRLPEINAQMLTAWSVNGEFSGLRIQMASAFHPLTMSMTRSSNCVTREGLRCGHPTAGDEICVIKEEKIRAGEGG
ncbi:hypothetical protein [Paraburkholderia lycopersici]|uniref:hypothetical protein n=1 Tax=Paraburkholderia lycopersici TaxID=416944 RepID=UPI0015A28871|nr:hypothetical protein [Paraburkholderia lycopersici]